MRLQAIAQNGTAQSANENIENTRLWSVSDVAKFVGASKSWVYHQAEAGRIPCIRLLGFLRFDQQVVRDFVLKASPAPAERKVK